ncbi:dysbindin domain-containing protein 1 isoform X2 [Ochotona princeps]|uniref:dysbindin domain-containing protein 1 isoform X2 n=1 Tax=Ochotona princeps TaxID=9978 RepID=UPI002714BB9E|nr:dysbindin domain-containing protein 1 isoform X2 [Ochotona princeps]
MEPPDSANPGETVKHVEVPQAALDVTAYGMGDGCHTPVTEDEGGPTVPAPGFLQVTERRRAGRGVCRFR